MQEFRSSQSYQWGKAGRVGGTDAFDSSYRQALDHNATVEASYARSKELGRVAQFMREWGSGAQTDFTTYAARRLAERGLLREDDPIALQRSITEIAYAYAKGGEVRGAFVPSDTPFGPSRPIDQVLRFGPGDLHDEFARSRSDLGMGSVRSHADSNEVAVRERQAAQNVLPGTVPSNDVGRVVGRRASATARSVAGERSAIAADQGKQSESYNSTVNRDSISRHHGGNQAVWDTVGAQSDNRAGLGTPPGRPQPRRWQMDKDGVPRAIPETDAPDNRTTGGAPRSEVPR